MRILISIFLFLRCAGLHSQECTVRIHLHGFNSQKHQVYINHEVSSAFATGVAEIGIPCSSSPKTSIVVVENSDTLVNERISSETKEIEFIIGTTSLPSAKVKGISKHAIESIAVARDIDEETIRNSQYNNLSAILGEEAGVNQIKTGNFISKPVIHGFSGKRIVIISNGTQLEGQDWGNEHAPEIDINSTKRIQLYKGASALQYSSNGVGGVIVTESWSDDMDKNQARFSTGGFSNGRGINSHMSVFKRLGKLPINIGLEGGIKHAGNTHAPSYTLLNTGFREQSFTISMAARASKRLTIMGSHSFLKSQFGIFKGAHIGNTTDLINAYSADVPSYTGDFSFDIDRPFQEVLHEFSSAKLDYKIDERSSISITYGRQYNGREEYDNDLPYDDSLAALNLPDFQLRLTTHTANLLYQRENCLGELTAGITGKYQKNTHLYREFIPNFYNAELSGYVIQKWITQAFISEFGLRYTMNSIDVYRRINDDSIQHNEYSFSGISGAWTILFGSDNLLHKINIASGWRYPWLNEMYSNGYHHGVAALEYGNMDLNPERSIQLMYSPEMRVGKFELNADVYGRVIYDFIYLQPQKEPTLTIQGAFPTFNYRQESVYSYGIDLSLDYSLTEKWTLGGSASAIRVLTLDRGETLPWTPAHRFGFDLKYTTRINKTLVRLGADASYVAKQWRLTDKYYVIPPPENYFLVGANVQFQIPGKRKRVDYNVSIGANNLINQKYRDYLNRFRYFTDDMGRNFYVKLNIPISLTKSNKYEKNTI